MEMKKKETFVAKRIDNIFSLLFVIMNGWLN